MINKIKYFSFALAAILLITLLNGCSAAENTKAVDLPVYNSGAIENEHYKLEMDDSGRFSLVNKQNNRIINSYREDLSEYAMTSDLVKSALSIQVFVEETGATQLSSQQFSVATNGLNIKQDQKEIISTYQFSEYGLTIPIHYTLYGKSLAVTIIPDEIIEKGNAKLLNVSIHPFFEGGLPGDDGFLVVPDGSGAIINFNSKHSDDYKQKIYGTDQSLYRIRYVENTQPVVMPMFGIGKKGDGLVLGVITAGAGDASVEATAGRGETGYNSAWASFNLLAKDIRHYPNDNRVDVEIYADKKKDTGPLQVTYFFEDNEKPDYVGLAKMYRKYLMDQYELSEITENVYPLAIDMTMASVKKKSFLGVPYSGVQTLTTFDEAQKIINNFAHEKIPTVLRLNGWSKQTATGNVISNARMINEVGSKKELENLIKTASENGDTYLANNISEVYSGGGLLQKRYAKNMRGAATSYQHFNYVTKFRESTGHYLLSNLDVLVNSEKFSQTTNAFHDNVGIGVTGLNSLYTDYSASKKSLSATVEVYETALERIKNKVAVSNGNEFSLGAANFIFDLPSQSSGFDISDGDIPFYQIALHNLIPYTSEAFNLSANPQKSFLKALETGSLLLFSCISGDAKDVRYSRNGELYASTYNHWKDIVSNKFKEYSDFMYDKQTKEITGHSKLAEGVFLTQYENEDAVVVNYSNKQYQGNGFSVEPVDYCFLKKGVE